MSALLEEDLWSERDADDSAIALMVPLHAAFQERHDPRARDFEVFFQRFLGHSDQLPAGLDRLEFSYLVARFAVLKAQRDGCDPMTERTRNWLDREIDTFLDSPAWQWEEPAFPNVPERIAWRLSADGHSIHKYQRALIDEDLFAMAIAADIKTVNAICGVPSSPLMTDAVDLAARSFDEQVVWTPTGGWLMQPGQWSDHPDYLYAGNAVVESSLEPSPIGDLAADSSHSHRLGLWLVSLRCEAETEGNLLQVRKYDELLHGLDAQLATVVATRTSDGVFLTNYMDGRNGVFRYGYETQGQGDGYGPWQLSGTFNSGWWAFSGARTRGLYALQLTMLPFSEAALALYIDDTSRVRNPAFDSRAAQTGPLQRETLVDAARLEPGHLRCG